MAALLLLASAIAADPAAERLSEASCRTLGFGPSLLCSSCAKLGEFVGGCRWFTLRRSNPLDTVSGHSHARRSLPSVSHRRLLSRAARGLRRLRLMRADVRALMRV